MLLPQIMHFTVFFFFFFYFFPVFLYPISHEEDMAKAWDTKRWRRFLLCPQMKMHVKGVVFLVVKMYIAKDDTIDSFYNQDSPYV